MLSKKTKYSLLALLKLAREYGQGPILISEIADEEGIPRRFLEAILLDFKNHGFLQSKKGKKGGYYLSKDPGTIMLGEVIRVEEGPLALLPCISRRAYSKCPECKDERTCGIRSIMLDVREAMVKILDGTSLSDVLNRERDLMISLQKSVFYEI